LIRSVELAQEAGVAASMDGLFNSLYAGQRDLFLQAAEQ